MSSDLGGPDSGVRLDARGSAAASLQAWSASAAGRARGAGLAVAPCARPGRGGWFLGAGSTLDQDGTILLSNSGSTAAMTDVSFLTADGAVRPTGTQGLVLEPGSELELEVAELIAGRADVAVRVEAPEGQVTAEVLDRWSDNRRPAGTEWLPRSTGPVTRALLAGLPTRVSAHQVVVANPGDLGAVVSVQVVGPDTTYLPEGLENVTVPAGSTASVALPAGLDGRLISLQVQSDRPVVSSVRSTTRRPGADVAYTVGATTLSGATSAPVALPLDVDNRAGGPLLALVATGRRDGTVRVQALDASGSEVATLDADVPTRATTVLNLSRRGDLDIGPRRAAEVAQIVLRPSGDVGAALVYGPGSAGLSVLPLASPPSTVVAPTVLPRGVSPRR